MEKSFSSLLHFFGYLILFLSFPIEVFRWNDDFLKNLKQRKAITQANSFMVVEYI